MSDDALLKNLREMIADEVRKQLKLIFSGGLQSIDAQPKPVNPKANGTSRRYELWLWLREQGPLKRRDIEARSGIPKGSISNLLKQNSPYFSRSANKGWSAVGDQPPK